MQNVTWNKNSILVLCLVVASSCAPAKFNFEANRSVASPALTASFPSSPTNSNGAPILMGTLSADVAVVRFFSDTACATVIGQGTRDQFVTTGVAIEVEANTSNTIFGRSQDHDGNQSVCSYLGEYTVDLSAPDGPQFVSSSVASPSSTSFEPLIKGTLPTGATAVELFSDTTCRLSLGQSSKAVFEAAGAKATLSANGSFTIFAESINKAGTRSLCTHMMDFVHDNIAPANPQFSSVTPGSPSNSVTNPFVKGVVDGSTERVELYSDVACATHLTLGTKGAFEGPGLEVNVTANSTTPIYGRAFDAASNGSACTILLSYTHDSQAPAGPGFVAFDPVSPSNTNNTPKIDGTAPTDAASVVVASDNSCSTVVGSGSSSDFTSGVLPLTLTLNHATSIYALTQDAANNVSSCTLMASFIHDTIAPAAPTIAGITNGIYSSVLTRTPKFYSHGRCRCSQWLGQIRIRDRYNTHRNPK